MALIPDDEHRCKEGCGRRAGKGSGLCRKCYVRIWKSGHQWHYGPLVTDFSESHTVMDSRSYQEWSGNYGREKPRYGSDGEFHT